LAVKNWAGWCEALIIVKPSTVVGWHRQGFKVYWTKLSQHRIGGRPTVSQEVRRLIRQMVIANPLWGAPRIHGELLKRDVVSHHHRRGAHFSRITLMK
jgi:putative transposase